LEKTRNIHGIMAFLHSFQKKKQHIINGLVQGKTLTGNRGFYHGKYMGFSG
jgi:hypothetical protein